MFGVFFSSFIIYALSGRRRRKKKRNNYNIASNRANNCKCKRSNKRVFKQRDVNRKITVGTGILSYIFSVYICLSGSKKLYMPSVVFQVFCSTNQVQVIVQLVISPPFFSARVLYKLNIFDMVSA